MKDLIKAIKATTDRADMHEYQSHVLTERVGDLDDKYKTVDGWMTDHQDWMHNISGELERLRMDVHGSSRPTAYQDPFEET
jgi:hypothetical protein